jgi:hypothetical protein
MAALAKGGKFYRLFTVIRHNSDGPAHSGRRGRNSMAGALAIAMFVALVGFGGRYFGWSDPDGHIQLALITSFILGIIGGFKARS